MIAATAEIIAKGCPLHFVELDRLLVEPRDELEQVPAIGLDGARTEVPLHREVGEVLVEVVFSRPVHGDIVPLSDPVPDPDPDPEKLKMASIEHGHGLGHGNDDATLPYTG